MESKLERLFPKYLIIYQLPPAPCIVIRKGKIHSTFILGELPEVERDEEVSQTT